MNFDLIGVVEESIKIKQLILNESLRFIQHFILYEDDDICLIPNFNGWYILHDEETLNLDYIKMLYKNEDFDSIKLLFDLYKEKLLVNNYEFDTLEIFGNIKVLKMFVDSCKDELIKLDEINNLLYDCCQNYECIKLLVDIYGDKLQIKRLYNGNVDVVNLLLDNYEEKLKMFDDFYHGYENILLNACKKNNVEVLIKMFKIYEQKILQINTGWISWIYNNKKVELLKLCIDFYGSDFILLVK